MVDNDMNDIVVHVHNHFVLNVFVHDVIENLMMLLLIVDICYDDYYYNDDDVLIDFDHYQTMVNDE